MSIPEHLDPETIYELTEGRLDPSRERAAEAHLLRCAACRVVRESCETTLGALRWYGEQSAAPPAGYWEGFWARWPIAGDVRAARRSRLTPALATAAVAIMAVGLWWVAERTTSDRPDPLVSTGDVSTDVVSADHGSSAEAAYPHSSAPPAREILAGTSWEGDVEVFERVTFAVGSVDPLSKGVGLTSLVENSLVEEP
jgi:hypothetical protein